MFNSESLKDLHITIQCLKNEMTSSDKERVQAAEKEYLNLLDEFYEEYEDTIAWQQYEAAKKDPDYFMVIVQVAFHYQEPAIVIGEGEQSKPDFNWTLLKQVLGGIMKSNSRIRFNPVTKETEIEGTEEFVKTYFDKLQAMISGAAEKKTSIKREPKAMRVRTPTKTKTVAKRKRGKQRITNFDSVVGFVQESREGISTAELQKRTGLSERQIWSIIYRATRDGKIRKLKRGTYGAVAASQK